MSFRYRERCDQRGAARHRPGRQPSSGQAGDLFVDSATRLWFCTVTGTPATWKQVQLA